jgi:hypothetical protein
VQSVDSFRPSDIAFNNKPAMSSRRWNNNCPPRNFRAMFNATGKRVTDVGDNSREAGLAIRLNLVSAATNLIA